MTFLHLFIFCRAFFALLGPGSGSEFPMRIQSRIQPIGTRTNTPRHLSVWICRYLHICRYRYLLTSSMQHLPTCRCLLSTYPLSEVPGSADTYILAGSVGRVPTIRYQQKFGLNQVSGSGSGLEFSWNAGSQSRLTLSGSETLGTVTYSPSKCTWICRCTYVAVGSAYSPCQCTWISRFTYVAVCHLVSSPGYAEVPT